MRTDVTDDDTWTQVVEEATRPSSEGFRAGLSPWSDPAADGVGWETLRDAAMATPGDEYASVLFLADSTTIASADHPILVVGTSRYHHDEHPAEFSAMRPFRCIPAQLWAVENNLNLDDLDWRDVAEHVDGAGVFRGF